MDPEAFEKKVDAKLREAGEDFLLAAGILGLWLEAHINTVSDVGQQVERREDDPPEKISQLEREARKPRPGERLAPTVGIEGMLDPADSIINRFSQTTADDVTSWILWECCPTSTQELNVKDTKKKWLPGCQGVITERTLGTAPAADVSNIFRVDAALKRRGLAAELAGVTNFEARELLRKKLISALTEDPPDTQFARLSLERVRNPDGGEGSEEAQQWAGFPWTRSWPWWYRS